MYTQINATDGSGEFRAYIASPTEPNKPAVVLMFEGYGLNSMIQHMADTIAKLGFYVICPDLYWRIEEGMQEYDDYDWNYVYDAESVLSENKAVEDLQAAAKFIKTYNGCNGKAVGIGFGLGGKLACLMSQHKDLLCNIAYYPLHLEKHFNINDEIKAPLLIHLAGCDEHVDQSIREATQKIFENNSLVDVINHEKSRHGFMREKSSYYNKTSAENSQNYSLEFIRRSL